MIPFAEYDVMLMELLNIEESSQDNRLIPIESPSSLRLWIEIELLIMDMPSIILSYTLNPSFLTTIPLIWDKFESIAMLLSTIEIFLYVS